jgi:hypothetical protein
VILLAINNKNRFYATKIKSSQIPVLKMVDILRAKLDGSFCFNTAKTPWAA